MKRLLVVLSLGMLPLLFTGCESPVEHPATEALPTTAAFSPSAVPGATPHRAAIHGLLSAFHGAIRDSDPEAMGALFAEDASLSALGQEAEGREAIVAFFEGSPPWGKGLAALAPTYKTVIEISGNQAEFAFECVYVPDTGNLMGQEVAAHLKATGVARKVGEEWLFDRFVGGPGPLP